MAYLHENFRHYSLVCKSIAESANLKIICLLIKLSLLAAFLPHDAYA